MEILFAIICEPRVCVRVRVWREKREAEGATQANESEKKEWKIENKQDNNVQSSSDNRKNDWKWID